MQIDSAQFQELVEHSAHLILCADPAGHILYVNSACRRALGFECGLPQNLSFVDLIHSDYRIEYKKLFRNLLEGQSVPRFETAMLASNGRTVSVEGSFICRFENEAPCLIQGVFLDITERKRAEDVLARQATAFLRVHNTLEARDRELANTLEQAEIARSTGPGARIGADQ